MKTPSPSSLINSASAFFSKAEKAPVIKPELVYADIVYGCRSRIVNAMLNAEVAYPQFAAPSVAPEASLAVEHVALQDVRHAEEPIVAITPDLQPVELDMLAEARNKVTAATADEAYLDAIKAEAA